VRFHAHVLIYLFPEYALVFNSTEAETNTNSLESGGKFKLSNNLRNICNKIQVP